MTWCWYDRMNIIKKFSPREGSFIFSLTEMPNADVQKSRKSLSVINIESSLAPTSKMSAFSGMCLVIGLMIGSGIV